MNLDEAQKQKVRQWIDGGMKLSEIQNKLASELGVKMTYMEVRFLLDDLKLNPADKAPEKPVELKAKAEQPAPLTEEEVEEPLPEPLPAEETGGVPGQVSVTVDQIARAGALVSGKVTFSDGKNAQWYLDQFGRLGVAPEEKGYKPSQADVMAFQAELQNTLARMGY